MLYLSFSTSIHIVVFVFSSPLLLFYIREVCLRPLLTFQFRLLRWCQKNPPKGLGFAHVATGSSPFKLPTWDEAPLDLPLVHATTSASPLALFFQEGYTTPLVPN
ncbi:hypothetical protein HanIR_Chr02g0087121 [Helianthus annuus]|nr:hypothetical protein HanIR_Chr02g0087121 [Helianthus annuus]